jgi:transposase-like protein
MEHLFLLRKQAHELKMRQMVEEITFGRHTIESAMSKYQVLTRSTVTNWLKRVQQEERQRTEAMENTDKKPATTLVEQVVQHADVLTGQVKQLQKQLEQAELQVLYYKNVIRVAEQELGLSIEKKSVTK